VDKAEATYKQRLVVEPKLICVLNASGYSQESKTFIAEQLCRLCDEDTVEVFEKILYCNDKSILAINSLAEAQACCDRSFETALKMIEGKT
jgi:hypothetical protein